MKIGLLDHMGYGNLGDAATQDVVIANIKRRLPHAQLYGFSLLPGDTAKRHGIPCYPIWRSCPQRGMTRNSVSQKPGLGSKLKSQLKKRPLLYRWAKPLREVAREIIFWLRSYRTLRGLDLLLISGGGQLDDLWHGPWLQPYNLFKFSLLTKLAGKKLYFLNVGAGPLQHPLSRFFAMWAVRLAEYRSFRDFDSQERIRSLGVGAAMQVGPDAVYGLDVNDLLNRPASSSEMPVVGINPMGFCDPRIWPRKDNSVYQDYLEKISAFSVWLLQQGYRLRFFSTDPPNDRLAIADLKLRLRPTFSSSELVGQAFPAVSESVRDVLQEISEFDFVVTSKYHGIVFSHVLGKPVISLSYHRKMDFAMQAVGQSRFCADIERFDVHWLMEAFQSLVENSSSIKSGSANAVQAYAAELSHQFDSLFPAPKS